MLTRRIVQGSIASVIASGLVSCRFLSPADPTLNPQLSADNVLTIGAAASLRESITAIAAEFERETGTTVQLSFAASGTLQRQIEREAPIDLFLSADERSIDALAEQAEIDTASRQTIARNCLVAIVPKNSPFRVQKLTDLTHVDRIAIGNPDTVPAGRYARAALEHAQIYDSLKTANKLVFGEHVRQVLAYVERGEVNAAIVYETDAAIAPDTAIVDRIPTNWTPPIVYSGAAIAQSTKHDTARAFLTFLQQDTARAIFSDRGFRPGDTAPNCAAPLSSQRLSIVG
jgi:molybdate transport system substrate-binding protein